MAIELYWGSGSPFAWRVLLALEVKKLPYVSRLLQFSKQEHKAPEYLALNPRGVVPTLRDGDLVFYESLAILAYLDRQYPDPPLLGRSADETGRIWQRISEYVSYLDGPTFEVVYPIYGGQAAEKADAIRAAMPKVHAELARVEGALAKTPWLVGNQVSAADLVVYPGVMSLLRAAGKPEAAPLDLGLLPLSTRYPAIAAWTGRVETLPGYDRTYPPHWR